MLIIYTLRFIRSDIIRKDVVRTVFTRSDVIRSDVIRCVIIHSVGESEFRQSTEVSVLQILQQSIEVSSTLVTSQYCSTPVQM